MKHTELTPLNGHGPGNPSSDHLTRVLIWVAFFLTAALVALAADVLLWPATDGPVAQASEPTRSPLPAGPTLQPTSAARPAAVASLPGASLEVAAGASPPIAGAPTEAISPTPVTPQACVPPDDWGLHTVVTGNTLYSLARRYGTDVETLMRVNCLNTHTIFRGQKLYVPGLLASPTPPAPTYPPPATPTPWADVLAASPDDMPLDATRAPTPTSTPPSPFRVNIPDRYLNIVLLGSDKRPQSGAWRTDSIIVVSVDTETDIVRLLSIPRDLWVYIPGHGHNRINTADLWGELAKSGTGPDRVKQTIHRNLGIPIHYYVRIDFQGFINIIDTVGGVDIDVDCPLPDIKLTAGMHHMTGKQALRYARSRKSTNDFDRGRRQRKVLMSLWEQALTLDVVPKLPELWRAMAGSFQTDLPLDQVINLAYVGVQLEPQRILSRAIGSSHTQHWMTPQGASVLLPREDRIRALLEDFYTPVDPDQIGDGDKVRIRVLNGGQFRQAEELAAAALRWDGVKVVSTGPADRQDYAQTRILVYAGDRAAAEKIAQRLGVPATAIQDLRAEQAQPQPNQPVDLQVILGRDYNPCQR